MGCTSAKRGCTSGKQVSDGAKDSFGLLLPEEQRKGGFLRGILQNVPFTPNLLQINSPPVFMFVYFLMFTVIRCGVDIAQKPNKSSQILDQRWKIFFVIFTKTIPRRIFFCIAKILVLMVSFSWLWRSKCQMYCCAQYPWAFSVSFGVARDPSETPFAKTPFSRFLKIREFNRKGLAGGGGRLPSARKRFGSGQTSVLQTSVLGILQCPSRSDFSPDFAT